MLIQDEFEVRAPIDQVWNYLLDVARVAPCAPGAELTEVVDERTWKGKVTVKLGPISMAFAGTVMVEQRDDQGHRVVLRATGREQRGRGSATAVVTSTLRATGETTTVAFDTDLTLTGAAAQYGRGMIGDISRRMTHEFAQCLQANIAHAAGGGGPSGEAAAGEAPTSEAGRPSGTPATTPSGPTVEARAHPVKGLRLGLWALWRAIVRFFRRLFGGRAT